jgi:putative lipoic acid-binding regulatory protein
MFENQRPEIEYPCHWSYRIVGTCTDSIRALVVIVAGESEHALEPSNVSSTGKYVSFKLTLLVRDEAHRHEVFQMLAADDSVRQVL